MGRKSLIIGIGGIGGAIAAKFAESLNEEQRRSAKVACIDTNINDLSNLPSSVLPIRLAVGHVVSDFLKKNLSLLAAFPKIRALMDRCLGDGAGQIRLLSLYAFMATLLSGGFNKLREMVIDLLTMDGDAHGTMFQIIVVGSLTGGTGSGIALPLPYFLRRMVKEIVSEQNVQIKGVFIGPDITVELQGNSDILKETVQANFYAVFKEIMALYLFSGKIDSERMEALRFVCYPELDPGTLAAETALLLDRLMTDKTIAADSKDVDLLTRTSPGIPYEYLFLLQKSSNQGTVGTLGLDGYCALVAQMLYVQLMTPMADASRSVEDNLVLPQIVAEQMNRISSAGYCRLVYPYKSVLRYASCRWINEAIKDDWLLVDRLTDQDMIVQQTAASSQGMPKEKWEFFVKHFEDVIKQSESGLFYLSEEVYRTEDSGKTELIDEYFRTLELYIDNQVFDDEIKGKEAACWPGRAIPVDKDEAIMLVNQVNKALQDFLQEGKQKIEEVRGGLINAVMPGEFYTLTHYMKDKVCLLSFLYEKHPLVARYLLYKLRSRLREQLKALQAAELKREESLSEFERYDFDPKNPGVQGPAQAILNNSMQGHFFYRRAHKANIQNVYPAQVDSHKNRIHAYLEGRAKQTTYAALCQRLDILILQYERFFDCLAGALELNKAEMQSIIQQFKDEKPTEIYLAANEASMEEIYQNYKRDSGALTQRIGAESKTAIAMNLYNIYLEEKIFYDQCENNQRIAERRKQVQIEKIKKQLADVFKKTIRDTMWELIRKNGQKTINLKALDAIKLSDELVNGNLPGFEKYLGGLMEKALQKSTPLIATKLISSPTIWHYLGLHPDNAYTTLSGDVDIEATKNLYLPSLLNETPSVHVDPAFSPHELVCYQAQHALMPDDLWVFDEGSAVSTAYRRRILGLAPGSSNVQDRHLLAVSPHLFVGWEEPARIPSLLEVQRTRDKTDQIRAFFFGLALDIFFPATATDGTEVWAYSVNNSSPQTLSKKDANFRDAPVSRSYAGLYEGLGHNSRLVRSVINVAEEQIQWVQRLITGVLNKRVSLILNTDIVQDWAQSSSQAGEDNILDVLLALSQTLAETEFNRLLNGFKSEIAAYCDALLDGVQGTEKERLRIAAYDAIIDLIVTQSQLSAALAAKPVDHEKAALAVRFKQAAYDVFAGRMN